MRRLVLIVVLVAAVLVLPLPAARAAGTWTVSRTGPHNDMYIGVDFFDSLWGWTVTQSYGSGVDVEIARTTDGGAVWPAITPDASAVPELQDVAMAGSWTGLAVGMANTIVRTTDMGATWSAVGTLSPATVHADFYSVDYANSMRAYAGGYSSDVNGVDIIMTVDAGSTWVDRSPPRGRASGEIWGLDFIDGAHGWALANIGNDLKILATTDFGVMWKSKSLGVDATPRDIYFFDALHGWALAGYHDQYLWRTTDGGATWTALTPPDLFFPSTLCFVSPTVGYMGTSTVGTGPNATTVLWKTTDAGSTWASAYDAPAGTWSVIADIDFTDADHGWASGVMAGDATVLKYTGDDPLPTPAPPTTVVSGVQAGGWYTHDETAVLEASVAFGGGWVRQVDWSTDLPTSGSIVGAAGQLTIAAPVTDRTVTIGYQATDGLFTVEATKLLTLGFDRTKPVTKGLYAASARRGRTATLKYKVVDAAPCGPRAKTVTIKVMNKSHKIVKTLRYTNKPVNTRLTARFTVPRSWKTGVYRFLVYATDNAGNPASKVGSNRLTVK